MTEVTPLMPADNTNRVDPMDAVIQQLQPAEGQSPVMQDPQTVPQPPIPNLNPVAQPEQAIEQPAQPQQEVPLDPTAADDLLKDIDDLLNEIEKDTKPEPKPEPVKKEIVSPKVLDNIDNENLTVEEKQEIITYVSDLETKVAEYDFEFKTVKIERDQLEHMLEKERAKNGEIFDKFKELERENKKVKAGSMPDDLQTLVDFYKLNKENNTLYNKRNLVGEAAKIIEQITEVKMDDYLMTWLKSGSYFTPEGGGASLDLPPAKTEQPKDTFNVLQF